MNRLLRNAIVLALAGTMTLGMNATVFAADTITPSSNLNINNSVSADTATINLIKDYVRGENSASDSVSPAEDFVFTITPYGVWNAGSSTGDANGPAYTVSNMPALAVTSNDSNVTVASDNDKKNVVTIKGAKAGETDVSTQITLNEFKSVGDFWYKVEETNSKTTGVFYGTNDNTTTDTTAANGGHDATYYIHVQVVNNSDYNSTTASSKKFLRSVTMHKTAPVDANGNDAPTTNIAYNTWANSNYKNEGDNIVKVNDIQNTYYAGELEIKKEVTGNAGDKDKYFKVTVKFTKPQGTIVNSDIPFTAVKKTTDSNVDTYTSTNFVIKGQNSNYSESGTVINWNTVNGTNADADEKTAICEFWIKDGTTVTFSNIPYGIEYEVVEDQPSDDTYKHSFSFDVNNASTADANPKFNGNNALKSDTVTPEGTDGELSSNWLAAKAVGSITDANDTVTITNNKESAIDVGVITSNAPYVAVLILAAAALVLYVRRRKDMFEE